MQKLLLTIGLGGALFLSPSLLSARFIESWPYSRLFNEADLIVIAAARFSEKTADPWPHGPFELKFVGVNTTFELLHVLKGRTSGNRIQVFHFKLDEPVRKPRNREFLEAFPGPKLVDFRARDVVIKGTRTTVPPPQYMMFLRKLPDGRYEPISGYYDPQLSVRDMFEPLHKELGGSAR